VTDASQVDPERVGSEESEPTGPRITDKRRIDPDTGAVRHARSGSGTTPEEVAAEAVRDEAEMSAEVAELVEADDVHPDTTLAADLTRDLQRLQAEYVNYKKRVDRDREMHRDLAVCSVIEALLPVLDDIHLARQHGDLEGGPFAAIADKLDATLTKIGVERYGQPGDPFDPTVVQVLQPGYRMGPRIIRVARVAVADPQTDPQS